MVKLYLSQIWRRKVIQIKKIAKKSTALMKKANHGKVWLANNILGVDENYAQPTSRTNKSNTKESNKDIKPKITEKKFVLEDQLQELIRLEQNTDVNTFKMNGVNIWPAIRYIIWMKLWYMSRSMKRASDFNPFEINIPKHIFDYYRSKGAIIPAELNIQADYLFFVSPNASDRAEIKESVYNRIIDAVYEKMLEKGASCIKICGIRSVSNRAFENYIYTPLYVIPSRIRTRGYIDDLQIPFGFDEQLSAHIQSINLSTDKISTVVDSYYDQVSFFKDVLQVIKPKTVFLINMGTQMPLIHAAREMNIKVVELQHGVQQANTPIYKTWEYLINEDQFLSYPTHFGVWGDDEATYISKEFKGIIKPIVMGYPWLDNPISKISKKSNLQKIRNITDSFLLVVAVTLQNQEAFPVELLKLAEQSKGKIAWLIRLHPKWNKIVANTNLPDNIIADKKIQELTLHELFSISDLHVTRDSASIYEATYQGVKSYVYSDMGVRAFEGLIERGIVGNLSRLKKDLNSIISSNEVINKDCFKLKKEQIHLAVNNDKLDDILKAMIEEDK